MSIRTRSERQAWWVACGLLVALTTAHLAPLAHAGDDPMTPYRERFKAGMERYDASDFAGAIDAWEAIYREVGAEKGYRIAYDLGRAYDKAGDETHAAEKYGAFLRVVDARRASGAALEQVVLTEETAARSRLAQIPPLNEPAPSPALAASTAPSAAEPLPPAAIVPVLPSAPTAPPAKPELRTETPFPAALLFVAGGVTVTAIVIGAVEYARALSAQSDFNAAAGNPQAQQGFQSTYDGIRPVAYGALGASIGLAAITAGLGVWYFAGTRTREVTLAPVVSGTPGGAVAGAIVRF